MKPRGRPLVFLPQGPPTAIDEPGMVASSALWTIPNHCLAAAPVASPTTRIIDLSERSPSSSRRFVGRELNASVCPIGPPLQRYASERSRIALMSTTCLESSTE